MLSQQHRKRVRFYNLLLIASVCAILLLFQQGGHAHAATNDGLPTPVPVGTCHEVLMDPSPYSGYVDNYNTTFHLNENVYAWYDDTRTYCGEMTVQATGFTDGNSVDATVSASLIRWSADGQSFIDTVESKPVEFIATRDQLPATTEVTAQTACGIGTADFNASTFSVATGVADQYHLICPPLYRPPSR